MKQATIYTHLTPTIENLQGILKDGFKPHFCGHYVCFQKKRKVEQAYHFYFQPIVSFLEVHLTNLKEHIKSYGNYGLVMSQHWAHKPGHLNPVTYFVPESGISKIYQELAYNYGSIEDINNGSLIMPHLKNFFGKPINLEIDEKFENAPENEWIYTPLFQWVRDEVDNDKKNIEYEQYFSKYYPQDDKKNSVLKANKKIEPFTLKFTTEDIKYIILNDFSEVLPMIDFLEELYGKAADKLIAKIITIRQLKEDF